MEPLMQNTTSRGILGVVALLVAVCGVGAWWFATRTSGPVVNVDASTPARAAGTADPVADGASTGDSLPSAAGAATAAAVATASDTSPAPGAAAIALPAPLPPPDTPLAQVIDELERRARAGDTAAACRLGFELFRCKRAAEVAAQRSVLNQVLVQTAGRGGGSAAGQPGSGQGEEVLVDLVARSDEMVELADAVCAGIDVRSHATPMDWLMRAATRGDAVSRSALLAQVDVITQGATLDNLDALARFRTLAPEWIAEEFERGGDVLQHVARGMRVQMHTGLLMQTLQDRPALAHALVRLDTATSVASARAIEDSMRAAALGRLPPADAAITAEATALAARYEAARAARSPAAGGSPLEPVAGSLGAFDPGVSAAACGRTSAPEPQ